MHAAVLEYRAILADEVWPILAVPTEADGTFHVALHRDVDVLCRNATLFKIRCREAHHDFWPANKGYGITWIKRRPGNEFGDDTGKVVETIEEGAAVIFVSPVYRGSFTGSLKNLLDHLPVHALMGKPCGIVAIGATDHHFLGVDWHLRDVLSWFGALMVPTSVYLSARDFVEGEPSDSARTQLRELVAAVIKLRAVTGTVGPLPLAARQR